LGSSVTAHTALSMTQFLTKNGMTPIVHPPYSPGLASYDLFLFPTLKRVMNHQQEALKVNSNFLIL
jgi:hypothetical protein